MNKREKKRTRRKKTIARKLVIPKELLVGGLPTEVMTFDRRMKHLSAGSWRDELID